MKKRYYLIEPLDIDGDKNPDGFLVSQYRIDKTGNRIFLKNKYITYKKLNDIQKKLKQQNGGAKASVPKKRNPKNNKKKQLTQIQPQMQQQANNMIVMTPEQYNQMLNNRAYPQQQYPQNNYQNNNAPAPFIYKDETGFYNSFKNGAGSAVGAGLGYTAIGWANVGIASMFFGE